MFFFEIVIESPSDREFLEKLYQRYGRFVWKTLFQIVRDADKADDLTQDAFERLAAYLPTLQALSENQLRAYLYRTAQSVALNDIKPSGKQAYFAGDIDTLSDGDTPEQVLLQRECRGELGAALNGLAERERQLLFLKYMMELDTREISRITGLKPDSVNKRLWDARRHALKLLRGKRHDK